MVTGSLTDGRRPRVQIERGIRRRLPRAASLRRCFTLGFAAVCSPSDGGGIPGQAAYLPADQSFAEESLPDHPREPIDEYRASPAVTTASHDSAPDKRLPTAQVPSRSGGSGRRLADRRRRAPPTGAGQPRSTRIDQQRAWLHKGKAAGIDQSCRFWCKSAGDQDRVAQRRHAIEVGQGKNGFGRRGIGDRAAVGGEDAAFEPCGAFRHFAPDPAVADDPDRAP
jgi:hypothetical protein